MRIPRFPLLSFLFGILLSFSPSVSFAEITTVSKGGHSLLLYRGYYALAIGVSNYQKWPKIPFAMQDATEVAERLGQSGFKTKLYTVSLILAHETFVNQLKIGFRGSCRGNIRNYLESRVWLVS